MAWRKILLSAALLASVTACGSRNEGTLDVALIGTEETVLTTSQRLSPSAQLVRAATQSGLVALNAQGETVPALAERWIVTDDGRSFIFRLREGTWPDGSEMNAASVRDALVSTIAGLEGTSLGKDLAPIEDVRAMAGRVIELRLSSPEPYLLQLLAQPEMALRMPGGQTGPMELSAGEAGELLLDFKPPLARGLPEDEDWQDDVRNVRLHVAGAQDAIRMFDAGEVDVVMGGSLGSLPQVETGPLSSGTLRIDATYGLFGLQVRSRDGLLSNDGVREGVAMAIDRQALLSRYNIGGWITTTRPVSPGLPGDPGLIRERWLGEPIEDLRAEARRRIADWRTAFDEGDTGQPYEVTLAIEEGPGWDRLYGDLAAQLRTVGIDLQRVDDARAADLVFIDRVARYPAPRWFLNQFNCELGNGLCVEGVDLYVQNALAEQDPALRARIMAQAEAELTLANVFIPIGAPLRWSLVRGSVDNFASNAYGFHPLPDMAQIPR